MKRTIIDRLGMVAVVFCAVGLVLSGCGPKGPELAPVEGVVTLDGQPLEGATVLFHAEGGGRPSTGTTDANGRPPPSA